MSQLIVGGLAGMVGSVVGTLRGQKLEPLAQNCLAETWLLH
jgi:hypothetical protein